MDSSIHIRPKQDMSKGAEFLLKSTLLRLLESESYKAGEFVIGVTFDSASITAEDLRQEVAKMAKDLGLESPHFDEPVATK